MISAATSLFSLNTAQVGVFHNDKITTDITLVALLIPYNTLILLQVQTSLIAHFFFGMEL
jgi:hypothetical protein